MMFNFFTLFSGVALLSSAAAQGTIHQIMVGNDTGGTIYNPNNINAAIGDTVLFVFHPKNHSVTQSSFAEPCTPLAGGFDSGFHPVAIGTSDDFPTFSITVNDTNPIWVHCEQDANTAASHCGKGMVFAVNPGAPGSNNSFENFQAEAFTIGAELVAANSTNATSVTTTTNTDEDVITLIINDTVVVNAASVQLASSSP